MAIEGEAGKVLVGYARVSTVEQETRLQLDALQRAGVMRVYQDKASGVGDRPQLRAALASMRPGDTLVVWKIDRVARSLTDLLSILTRLSQSRVSFRSLTEPVDTSTPIGEFILQVLGAVAQLERSMIRQRCIAGQVAAYERGVRWGGRARTLDDDDARAVQSLYESGWYTMATLGLMFGVSRQSISRIITPRPPTPYRSLPVLRQYLQAPA